MSGGVGLSLEHFGASDVDHDTDPVTEFLPPRGGLRPPNVSNFLACYASAPNRRGH